MYVWRIKKQAKGGFFGAGHLIWEQYQIVKINWLIQISKFTPQLFGWNVESRSTRLWAENCVLISKLMKLALR